MKTPIVGGAYSGQSVDENPQQCINLYPKIDKEGGKSSLCGAPGLIEKADLSEYTFENLLVASGERLLVASDEVLKVVREG